ncbi:FkbM family methyltransferase [Candidatus Pelagibacter sp.]|jgi:FkbM family methyltransferase|nr:FkbM family methyltransferase [Candidatus Pelagibacter sp.]
MNFLRLYQKIDDALSYLLSSVCDEKKLLKENIKKKEIVFVDIGTNVGNYVEFVNKIFKIKTLYCFEPQIDLIKNLEEISYVKKKYIFPFALSNTQKLKNFYQYDIASQSSFHKQVNNYNSLQKVRKVHKMKTSTFDKVFNKNLNIDFCKIDAQGEDFNILKGMEKNLKKGNIKILKVEVCFSRMYEKTGSSYLDVLNFLHKLNYNLISISKIKYVKNELLFMDAFFKKNYK